MLKKKCQIHAHNPITCFSVPIVGSTELNLTEEEIYKCLCSKAEVFEILSNGKMINLNFTNYNRDNSIIGEPAVIRNPIPIEEIGIPFTGETPEPIETEVVAVNQLSLAEEIEEVQVSETITTEPEVEEETESVVEESEEIKSEDDTVKDTQVKSRNDNYKNNKNKKNNNRK